MQQKQRQSIRLFENPWLEKLSHVHPITPLVLWAPVVGYLIWRALFVHQMSVLTLALFAVVGLLTWTLTEYVLHRYVFHFKAETPFMKRVIFLFHGIHHDDPEDATRLVMPPAAAVILASILYGFFWLIFGSPWVEPFFAFFLVGYLCYDYIHFYTHHFQPKNRIGKFLKHYHMLHHYATPEARWGVSSPLWDYVFGTVSEKTSGGEHQSKSV